MNDKSLISMEVTHTIQALVDLDASDEVRATRSFMVRRLKDSLKELLKLPDDVFATLCNIDVKRID